MQEVMLNLSGDNAVLEELTNDFNEQHEHFMQKIPKVTGHIAVQIAANRLIMKSPQMCARSMLVSYSV